MFETRKEFLQEIMRRTGLKSLEEADRVAQVIIGLIKVRIGPELSEKVASAVPPDLAKGWTAIALPSEAMELQEMMFELEEVGEEEPASPQEKERPEYG
jgi:uncharacterized protein (DUF2267 family)